MKQIVALLMTGLTVLSVTPLLVTAVAVTWLLGDDPSYDWWDLSILAGPNPRVDAEPVQQRRGFARG